MEIMVVQIAADGVEIAPYQKQGKGFTQLSKMFWTTLQSWREPSFQKEGVGVRAAMNPQSKVWGTEDKRIMASWTMTIFCLRELRFSISVSRAIYARCWKPSWLGVKANPLRRDSLSNSEARLTSASSWGHTEQRSRALSSHIVSDPRTHSTL